MTTVDFLEIPKANTAVGDQDTFELLARDLLEELGFKIVQGPGRGADCGRDLVVEERRIGVGGETTVRWIVSCKHYAHGGKSVGVEDETNILDRIKAGKAVGFLAFYSTLASAALVTKLQELLPDCEHSIFDRAKIETHLLTRDSGHRLFSRYFPISYRNWSVAHPPKPKLYFEEGSLDCAYCGNDLLSSAEKIGFSMFVMWEDRTTLEVNKVYWCCKGHCDDMLRSKHASPNHYDLWEELGEYTTPTTYILAVTNAFSEVSDGRHFTSEAWSSFRKFLITTFHHVSRELTPKEEENIKIRLQCGL